MEYYILLCAVITALLKHAETSDIPYEFSCHRGGKLGQKNDLKGDTFCEEAKAQNCPFIPRRYWCGHNYTFQIMQLIKSEYPNSRVGLVSFGQEWLEVVGKIRSILFIGDSVHSHTAFSLMCALKDYSIQKKYSFSHIFPYTKVLGRHHTRVSRKYFCTKTKRKEVICYDRTDTAQNIVNKYAVYKRLLSEFGVVVMNFGLHGKNRDLEVVDDLMQRLTADLAKSRTLLIWRETAPQHFRNVGGVFSPDALGAACSDISGDSVEISNKFNLEYNPIMRKYDIPILEIWNMSRQYYNAHVQGECTHYCQPGVPELWLERLKILIDSRILQV
jgi:hypothetical protein